MNFTHDFVPAGGPVTSTREIVDVNNCNQCHGKLTAHGSRFETKYCVMCHNPDLNDANGNSVDLKVFIHKIHYSSNLPSVRAGVPYVLAGDSTAWGSAQPGVNETIARANTRMMRCLRFMLASCSFSIANG